MEAKGEAYWNSRIHNVVALAPCLQFQQSSYFDNFTTMEVHFLVAGDDEILTCDTPGSLAAFNLMPTSNKTYDTIAGVGHLYFYWASSGSGEGEYVAKLIDLIENQTSDSSEPVEEEEGDSSTPQSGGNTTEAGITIAVTSLTFAASLLAVL